MESGHSVNELARKFGLKLYDNKGIVKSLIRPQTLFGIQSLDLEASIASVGKSVAVDDNPFLFTYHKEYQEFVVATYLYNKGNYGLSPQQIAALPYSCLAHAASELEVLDGVCQDGELKIGGRTDQFPGIYATVEDYLISRDMRELTFILPLPLLMRKAWHCNIHGHYGTIDDYAYDYTSFHMWLMKNWNKWGPHIPGEFVFHNSISLDEVGCIVVQDEFIDEALATLDAHDVDMPLYTVSKFTQNRATLMSYRYKGMYKPMASNPEPCYNYYVDTSDYGEYYVPDSWYMSFLKNSGMTEREAKFFVDTMDRAELDKYARELSDYNKAHNIKHPVVVHPPY